MNRGSSGIYSQTYIDPPPVNGGGGGGMVIGQPVIGGTPMEILYIDDFGNLFGDLLFTRDSLTNATRIGAPGSSVIIGDVDQTDNLTTITVRDDRTSIDLNAPLGTVNSGDVFGSGNGTKFFVIDQQNQVFSSGQLIFFSPVTTTAGHDLSDIHFSGSFTGAGASVTYTVTIDSTGPLDTFSWSSTAGGSGSMIPVTTGAIMDDSISAIFDNPTGHGFGDQWFITYTSTFNSMAFKLDYINDLYEMGDISTSGNGSIFTIDDQNQIITAHALNINIDVPNGDAVIGDTQGIANNTQFIINDAGRKIILQNVLGDIGVSATTMVFDSPGGKISIGDVTQVSGLNCIIINNGFGTGPTTRIKAPTNIISIGDTDEQGLFTTIAIDDQSSLFTSTGNLIYIGLISSSLASPSDLNDISFFGTYSGFGMYTIYTVTIDSVGAVDTYSWSDTSGGSGSLVPCNTPTLMDNGINVSFGAATGHTLSDRWQVTASSNPGVQGLSVSYENDLYQIGDINGAGGATLLIIDDFNRSATLSALAQVNIGNTFGNNQGVVINLNSTLVSESFIFSEAATTGTTRPFFQNDLQNDVLSMGDIDHATGKVELQLAQNVGKFLINAFNGTVFNQKITGYNGDNTLANGVSSIVGDVDALNQSSSIGATTIITAPNDGITHKYRLTTYAVTSTGGTAGTVVAHIGYQDEVTTQSVLAYSGNLALISSGTNVTGTIYFTSIPNQQITYSTTVSGIVGTPAYNLHMTLERLK